MNIKEKVIVVTGGASGLGLATAMHLMNRGARVMILDMQAPARDCIAQFNETQYRYFNVDITDPDMAKQCIDTIIKIYVSIHGCVNCAGIAPAKKIIDREGRAQTLDSFSQVINVNLIGSFNICRLVAESMSRNSLDEDKQERGIIINTASVAAYDGQKGQCAYAASKGGLVSMTLPMARDLSTLGIRVNAIAPGVMATPMMLEMPDKVKNQLSESVAFPKRLGHPSEFALLVEQLITNSYINGETIRLDGGLRMQ